MNAFRLREWRETEALISRGKEPSCDFLAARNYTLRKVGATFFSLVLLQRQRGIIDARDVQYGINLRFWNMLRIAVTNSKDINKGLQVLGNSISIRY